MEDVNVNATTILISRCIINFPLRPQPQLPPYYWTSLYDLVLHKIVSLIYLNLIIPQKIWLNLQEQQSHKINIYSKPNI